MRLSWFLLVSSSKLSRGISLTHATRRFVFTIIRWLFGSYAPLPQFTPPTFPGTTTVPCRLGGAKIPSDRDVRLRNGAFFHWKQRGSGEAIQNKYVTHLRVDRDGWRSILPGEQ